MTTVCHYHVTYMWLLLRYRNLQVCQSPNHEYGQMGNFKVFTTFNQSLGQTAPSARKCLKTQFWGPLTNWKFEPSPKAHTHSDLIINKHTEQVQQKICADLSRHALNSTPQEKSKDSRHTHQNPLKPSPVSERSAYPPAKLCMLFTVHTWVREILIAAMGKCKQINNSNLQYVSDVISLIIPERNYMILSLPCFLP